MRKKLITGIAAVGLGVAAFGGVADAKSDKAANGGCVAAGVKILSQDGGIGAAARSNDPGTIAAVIQAHLDGVPLLSGADAESCPNPVPSNG